MSQNDHQPDLTGPGSPLYQVLSDGVMLYTALPVLVFAVASEGGGQGVDDHDRVAGIHARGNVGLGDILDRLLNSADMVIGLVFAGDELEQRPVGPYLGRHPQAYHDRLRGAPRLRIKGFPSGRVHGLATIGGGFSSARAAGKL